MADVSLSLSTTEYPLTVVNGTTLSITLSGPAGPAGATGATGATGPAGAAGSDATVTNANVGAVLTGATAKTTPVDADTIPLTDSAASNALKKITWANIKATLSSYFGTVYAALVHTHVSANITDATSTATANKIVLRDATGGANFGDIGVATVTSDGDIKISGETGVIWTEGSGGNIYTIAGHIQSGSTFKLYDGTYTTTLSHSPLDDRAIAFPDASGTVALTTSNVATATTLETSRSIFGIWFNGSSNVSGNAINAGYFASIPTGGVAGHFITLNGTTPTTTSGRSIFFSDGAGTPCFRNGTSSFVNLVTTGVLGTGVYTFLTTPSGANLAAALQTALPVSKGGTGLVNGTSGGIPAYTGNTTLTSSGVLDASALVVGGGAGAVPSTVTTGTGVLTLISGTPTGTSGIVGKTAPTVTDMRVDCISLLGDVSASSWSTSGIRIKPIGQTFTNTSSTGTVATAYTDLFGLTTLAATNAITYTTYITSFFRETGVGTNVTVTNKYALGAESARFGTSNFLTISTGGILIAGAQLRLKGYTVSTLPAGTVGDTAYVTDALAPTFLTTLVGGGAITTKAFYNGTNWVAQ